eukprot:13871610-Alexandrium_andersonii.AAC.1
MQAVSGRILGSGLESTHTLTDPPPQTSIRVHETNNMPISVLTHKTSQAGPPIADMLPAVVLVRGVGRKE